VQRVKELRQTEKERYESALDRKKDDVFSAILAVPIDSDCKQVDRFKAHTQSQSKAIRTGRINFGYWRFAFRVRCVDLDWSIDSLVSRFEVFTANRHDQLPHWPRTFALDCDRVLRQGSNRLADFVFVARLSYRLAPDTFQAFAYSFDAFRSAEKAHPVETGLANIRPSIQS
jgi:hypothetical protein